MLKNMSSILVEKRLKVVGSYKKDVESLFPPKKNSEGAAER